MKRYYYVTLSNSETQFKDSILFIHESKEFTVQQALRMYIAQAWMDGAETGMCLIGEQKSYAEGWFEWTYKEMPIQDFNIINKYIEYKYHFEDADMVNEFALVEQATGRVIQRRETLHFPYEDSYRSQPTYLCIDSNMDLYNPHIWLLSEDAGSPMMGLFTGLEGYKIVQLPTVGTKDE